VSDAPLAGRRVLVTRAARQAGKLSEALRALGAEPVEVPLLEIIPPESYEPLDAALRQLDSYDWLILTSANTVRVIEERLAALGLASALPEGLNVAAVGEATARAARSVGFNITLVPVSYVSESLLDGLDKKALAGSRVLLARAAVARDLIPDALMDAGASVDVVDAYRNAIPEDSPDRLRAALAQGIDAVTFTSSSSVTHLAEVADKAGIAFPFPGVPAISIGPITSETLRAAGWSPAAEADPSDIPGLVAAVTRALS
jgi:uroporphyrinogen-III synthase/uroporphyrinogen III methyltransferase/synthase